MLVLIGSPILAQSCVPEDDPQYAVICADSGSNCERPTLFLDGSPDAQGASVIVQIPNDGNQVARAIKLTTFWKDTAGIWHKIWEHRSVQGMANGIPGGSQVRLGVPGLEENLNAGTGMANYVEASVEWDNGTSCRSDRLAIETPTIPDDGPGRPDETIAWVVRDDYRRPPTDPTCPPATTPPGDGLGPLAVYGDCASSGGIAGRHGHHRFR